MEIHLEFENFGDEKKLSDRFSLYVTFFFYDALNPLNIDRKTKKTMEKRCNARWRNMIFWILEPLKADLNLGSVQLPPR